jgi:RimJ/RimL family protein N-acetyltransferase
MPIRFFVWQGVSTGTFCSAKPYHMAKNAGILAIFQVVQIASANAPVNILSIFNAVRLCITGYVLLCKAVPPGKSTGNIRVKIYSVIAKKEVAGMYTLPAEEYEKVKGPLSRVSINTLFVEAVICGDVPGTVYVDDIQNPSVFYIVHAYGMSLLFGDTDNEAFNTRLAAYLVNGDQARKTHEWMQVCPDAWTGRLEEMLGDNLNKKDEKDGDGDPAKVVEFTRVNFAFDPDQYREAVDKRERPEYEIIPTTPELYKTMEGSVIPRYFWKDAEQFIESGGGYTLICDGEAAATAFTAYRIGDQLEIGIETMEKYWGRGFAFWVCAALIDHCLENHLRPDWTCRLENTGSYILAQRLGFVPNRYLPYYRLAV